MDIRASTAQQVAERQVAAAALKPLCGSITWKRSHSKLHVLQSLW